MAATPPSQNTLDLKTQRDTLVKQFLEYDIDQRVTRVVTAKTSAVNGDPATEVRYAYVSPVGSGSNIVEKMTERAVDSNGVKIPWLTAYNDGSLP